MDEHGGAAAAPNVIYGVWTRHFRKHLTLAGSHFSRRALWSAIAAICGLERSGERDSRNAARRRKAAPYRPALLCPGGGAGVFCSGAAGVAHRSGGRIAARVGALHATLVRMAGVDDQDIYGIIGEEGFARLVGAFYAQVPHDDVLGPMYPADDLAGAEQRLRDFLVVRFGGPARYYEQRGHPRLRMRHAPFAIDQEARDRWVKLMGRALDEAALPEEVSAALREFLFNTATFLINRAQRS
jgi:hemoglobin